MTQRTQRILIVWTVAFAVIYVATLGLLFNMIPPPRATLSAQQIADWYAHRHTRILIGAAIASWTSAFMLPLSVVIAVQLARLEGGRRIWSITALASGVMSSIFIVLPTLFWGVAAFTPSRDPQVTALMHQLGVLTYVAAVPYFIFMWVAIIVFCFRKTTMPHSPFPRWFGYLNIWIALLFEAGPIAFLTKTGPFAWNGLLAFWSPFALVCLWLSVMITLLFNAIKRQQGEDETTGASSSLAPASA